MNSTARTELAVFNDQLADMSGRLAEILPDHITPEVFKRTTLAAVQHKPELLSMNRQKVLLALYDAAGDGLLPDGYEGAIVPRKGTPVWQPMVWGITKLARNAGLRSVKAHIVYEGEEFRVLLGDEDRIHHVRDMSKVNLDKAVAVYGIAVLADGTVIRRHMPASRVLAIKKLGAANGPWNGPFQDEMWIKTALLYLFKWVPLSSSVDAERRLRTALERDQPSAIGHDDDDAPAEVAPPLALTEETRLDALDALLGGETQEAEPVLAGDRMSEPRAKEITPQASKSAAATAPDASKEITPERDPVMIAWVDATVAAFGKAKSAAAMFKLVDSIKGNRDVLREEAPELEARLDAAVRAANVRLAPLPEVEIAGADKAAA